MKRAERLSQAFLDQLASTMATLGGPAPGIGMAPLAALAAHVPAGTTVTVDFQAARSIGAPLVVIDRLATAGDAVAITAGPREPGASPDGVPAGRTGAVAHGAGPLARLTPREHEVAGLVAAGFTNKTIARRLGLTVGTVKDHVHRILGKCSLGNRAALASLVTASEAHPRDT